MEEYTFEDEIKVRIYDELWIDFKIIYKEVYKKQKRGHNKNIQLIKKLDREILILPLSIPPLCEAVEWGIFM